MSEKNQFVTTHRATKLCVSTHVVSGSNLTLYMAKSLFYQSKSRQTHESWTLSQSPIALSVNLTKISSYQNQRYPSQSGQNKTANQTAVCYAFRLEVQRSPTQPVTASLFDSVFLVHFPSITPRGHNFLACIKHHTCRTQIPCES